MTPNTESHSVRQLLAALADAEDELRELRLEPMTDECRAKRAAIVRKQAHLVQALRRHRRTLLGSWAPVSPV